MAEFSKTDKVIIDSYKSIARGIASFFGAHCEVVIHSLESLEQSVVYIENGHISGRSIGAPITNYALELISPKSKGRGFYQSYDSMLPNGKQVKSITVPVLNADKVIGLFCINLDMEVDFMTFIKPFITEKNTPEIGEYLGRSLDDMLQHLMDSVVSETVSNAYIPNQEKNKHIIISLNEVGFFQLKGSTEALADRLQISIHTIYAHLRKHASKDSR